MREKFDHSKMSAEELAKTQVLNLSDVEKLANYEKSTSKKPAIVLGIIGLFALSMGLFYPKVVALFNNDKEENVVYNRIDDELDDIENPEDATFNKEANLNSQLTCTKTSLANADGTDTTLTYNFSFLNNALQSYTKLAIFNANATNPNGTLTVENLYNGYLNLSQTPINGYYLQTSKTSNGLTVNVNIDLTKLDVMTFPDSHKANNVSNVEFTLNASKDIVNQTAVANGFVCQ